MSGKEEAVYAFCLAVWGGVGMGFACPHDMQVMIIRGMRQEAPKAKQERAPLKGPSNPM